MGLNGPARRVVVEPRRVTAPAPEPKRAPAPAPKTPAKPEKVPAGV